MEIIKRNGIVTRVEQSDLPGTIGERGSAETRISGNDGEYRVVKKGAAATEIGEM